MVVKLRSHVHNGTVSYSSISDAVTSIKFLRQVDLISHGKNQNHLLSNNNHDIPRQMILVLSELYLVV